MASLILYQITILGYFITKKFYYTSILIPLPIMLLIFIYTCTMKFYQFFQCTALEVASHEVKEMPNMEAMFQSFIPACLRAENSDEHHFEGALGHVCRASRPVASSC